MGQNSLNSSCQFWNHNSIPLQILHHSSLPWLITPLWILSSYFFYFGLKDPIKIPISRFLSALVKICYIPHVIFQTTSQFFFKFCITLQYHERQLLCTFLGQTLNTLLKRSKWKRTFWRLVSALVKFSQILVIFETTDQFFFQILH